MPRAEHTASAVVLLAKEHETTGRQLFRFLKVLIGMAESDQPRLDSQKSFRAISRLLESRNHGNLETLSQWSLSNAFTSAFKKARLGAAVQSDHKAGRLRTQLPN